MKPIATLAVSALIVAALYTSCKTPAEKVDKAQEKVTEANQNLQKVNNDYLADIENYRLETANKIAANNERIAEFKARILTEKKSARAKYTKKIDQLERKNTDLQKRMDEYRESGKENWEHFKQEFKTEMDELGKSFQDVFINNVDV